MKTWLTLAEYAQTRAWRQLDDESRKQVLCIAAIEKTFYLRGFWSERENCWLLDELPAHPERDDAREIAQRISFEFPDTPTRTWKITQQFPGEFEQVGSCGA
jgi:hypothetical protein